MSANKRTYLIEFQEAHDCDNCGAAFDSDDPNAIIFHRSGRCLLGRESTGRKRWIVGRCGLLPVWIVRDCNDATVAILTVETQAHAIVGAMNRIIRERDLAVELAEQRDSELQQLHRQALSVIEDQAPHED